MSDRPKQRAAEEHPAGEGVMYIRAQIHGPDRRSWLRKYYGDVVRPEWDRLSEEDRQQIEDLWALDRPKAQ